MKAVPDQIARWIPHGRSFTPLGTDGFGRSDTREALRAYFEIDAPHVVVATLSALAERGDVKPELVVDAIKRYGLDPDSADPRLLPQERTQRQSACFAAFACAFISFLCSRTRRRASVESMSAPNLGASSDNEPPPPPHPS